MDNPQPTTDPVVEVLESRPIWRELPSRFLVVIAGALGATHVASEFAELCERSGILKDKIPGIVRLVGDAPDRDIGALTTSMLATTLTSYANVMGDKNEFREAKRALDLALRLKPQHRPAWSSMALVAFMTGDRGAALSWAQKVLSDQPDPNSGDPWEAAAAELMTPEGQKFAAEALGEPQSVGTWEKVQDQMRVIEGVCRCGTVDKSALIKDLVGLRMRHDPHSMWASTRAWYAESLSDFQLAGLPEATIVTIVETWAIGTRAGVPDAEIFARIEDHRSGPLPRGELPTPLNLTNYVKYRLALEYAHEGPIGELFVESAVKLAREAYGA